MKAVFAAAALAGLAAAAPQGVTSAIAPSASAPAGCSTSYDGSFAISVVNVTSSASKRSLEARKVLTMTLNNGVLIDDEGRTGYIAANRQFQFDKPAQTGAIYTAGWSVCSNGTLAIGGSAIFYQCLSGTFYNLYDQSTGNQCSQIYIDVLNQGTSVSSAADGQVTAASATGAISQISDGQIQATTATHAVSQISDGQIQATTGTARAPVSQISDGQIQATTGTSRAPVTQISDGQIQASTGTRAPVTQISDGQIQATTGTSRAPVTQISDGQIQATAGTSRAPVTQISDGQIQATTGASAGTISLSRNATQVVAATQSPISSYTGAAALPTFASEVLLAAGALAVALL